MQDFMSTQVLSQRLSVCCSDMKFALLFFAYNKVKVWVDQVKLGTTG